MATAGWDSIASMGKNNRSSNSNGGQKTGSDIYMKLKSGENKVRFVGEPEPVRIVWINKKKFILPKDKSYEEKCKEFGLEVRENIACNVIDRNDEKLRFKVLEKGPSVYEDVILRYNTVLDQNNNKIHPGGAKGEDWIVIMTVPADPRNTKYKCTPLRQTPFTKEEKELIARGKAENADKYKDLPLGERGLIDLKELYSDEKAKKRMDELFKELSGGSSETSTKTEKKTESKASKADTDSLLSDDDDEVGSISDVEESDEVSDDEFDAIFH
jgi:hypothetical protein